MEQQILQRINQVSCPGEEVLLIILNNGLCRFYRQGVVLSNINIFIYKNLDKQNDFEIDKYSWEDVYNLFLKEGEKSANYLVEINDGSLIKVYNLSKDLAQKGFKFAHTKINHSKNLTNLETEKLFLNYCHPRFTFDTLKKIWQPDLPKVLYRLSQPEWFMGMTNQFVKDIHNFDRKMQGRILEAISEILSQPTTIKGDTIKPLISDKKGLWRYRIGDYRLIYHPDIQSRKITLMNFASRGDIYD